MAIILNRLIDFFFFWDSLIPQLLGIAKSLGIDECLGNDKCLGIV